MERYTSIDDIIMRICTQRRHKRLWKNFQVKLRKRIPGTAVDVWLEGNTLNLSQSGACIRTNSWPSFKVEEFTQLTFLLPPDFTGKDAPVELHGSAIVKRVDSARKSIAVEFINELREFKSNMW
ncbi:MAG: PilZ domain-containing protein [Deltaproteobacteria bacterium]|nr:PilZ domain-containing protein [Deltaproteobacteria bacterium]MBW2070697.1 PilZ domain-containing protein [Deltaproteobacteria bacterium]